MQDLPYSVVIRLKLLKKAKLLVIKKMFVPILSNGHESFVMAKRMQSQVQASKMILP